MALTEQHRNFKKLLQQRRAEEEKSAAYTDLIFSKKLVYAAAYLSATENVLDVIQNHGYVLLDKDGNRVNPENASLACGIWHKGD